MYATKKTIGKQGLYIPKPDSLGYDINPAYVIVKPEITKLNKLQKKRKARKKAHQTRMYNYLHR